MYTASTLTQKGQIVIPKLLRDHFNLKANDKMILSISGEKIVIKRAPSVEDMYGIFHQKRGMTKKEMKETIRTRVREKHKAL
ncbi:MAG TPA: AbrB/MazE/SpoVT family DNA-binding domain-containing protein [Patescibacteria group bacterium]|nr:AbrB/MazE/SpoVT family DNA-binding domain-containing protein [Patescibacteria group bacterium]